MSDDWIDATVLGSPYEQQINKDGRWRFRPYESMMKEFGPTIVRREWIYGRPPSGSLCYKAQDFAAVAHRGQVRKYTGEPYITHCAEVVRILRFHVFDEHVLAAAWLHDVLEDTSLEAATIEREFGEHVLRLVQSVTDVSRPSDGNRARRKQIDLEHLAKAPLHGKIIKLADVISNSASICTYDPKFARVYMPEMHAQLLVLRGVNNKLWNQAYSNYEWWLANRGAG